MASCSRARGFAYVWTLMLVAFTGVGSMIASELYSTSVRRDKERELLFIGREFRGAIERYYNSGPQGYPQALDALLKDPRFASPRRHLRRLYTDPMTGKNEWGTIIVGGRIVGVYSLSEQAPIKQDNFDVSENSFRARKKYSDWTFTYPADLFVAKDGSPVAGPARESAWAR